MNVRGVSLAHCFHANLLRLIKAAAFTAHYTTEILFGIRYVRGNSREFDGHTSKESRRL